MNLRLIVSLFFSLILAGVCVILLSSRQQESTTEISDFDDPSSADEKQATTFEADLVARLDLSGLEYEEQMAALIAEGWSKEDATLYVFGRILNKMVRNSSVNEEKNYWEPYERQAIDWDQRREQEKVNRQFEEILGELTDRPGFSFHRPAIPLPKEKQKALRLLEDDYKLLRTKMFHESGRMLLPEDQEALAMLEKSKREDLEALLTPEELFEYDLRASNLAENIRHQLDIFAPTEEEFREIFRTLQEQKQAEEKLTETDPGELWQEKHELDKAAEQELEEFLGERYVNYKRSRDPDYQKLTALTVRLDLPQERADQVFDFKDIMRSKRAPIEVDQKLDPDVRENSLKELNEELHEGVKELLGEKAYEVYLDNGGRSWIDGL